MKTVSLFSGIGGFDLAADRAGIETVAQVEIDPTCRKVLERHWPYIKRFEDIREIKATDLPQADLICAGFPCQDLSVAGKRGGLKAARSGLFFQITRIVKEMREATNGRSPTFVLLENVPGLFSSNRGRDFAMVLREVAESGAMDIAWTILDSRWFGVAQRRRRVFIVADFRGRRAGQILSIGESVCGDSPPSRQARQVIGTIPASAAGTSRPAGQGNEPDFLILHENKGGNLAEADHARALRAGASHSYQTVATLNSGGNSGGFRTEPGEHLVADTLSAGMSEGVNPPGRRREDDTNIVPCLRTNNRNNSDPGMEEKMIIPFDLAQITSSKNYSNPKPGDAAPPLNTAGRHRAGSLTMGVRRLTPRETERLQAFPDDWTRWDKDGNELSDSARYRMIGNAVTVSVVEWILKRLLQADIEQRREE